MQQSLLFLDFDKTLFDTEQLREWLGDDIEPRIRVVEEGALELPDLARMLYPDTLSFLTQARGTHHLVLLTATVHPIFQKKKVFDSGIAPYFDDILIVKRTEEDLGKGAAAKLYLLTHENVAGSHVFVDDFPQNISEVKRINPNVRCIEIRRTARMHDAALPPSLLSPDATVTSLAELLKLL